MGEYADLEVDEIIAGFERRAEKQVAKTVQLKEKPHACELCGRKFMTVEACSQHTRDAHKDRFIMENSFFGSLYTPYQHEREAFGDNWCGPNSYQHMQDVLCASYKAEDGGDGQDVDVYCCAMPARFYTIVGKPGKNSCGDPAPGWEFGTGSSGSRLAADIAKAASEGMLGFHPVSRISD